MNTVLKIFLIVIGITFISSCTPENPVAENKPDIDSTFTGTNVFIGDSHVQAWDLHYFFSGKKTENYGIGGENIWQINNRLVKFPLDSVNNCFIIAGINDFGGKARGDKAPVSVIFADLMKRYGILLENSSVRFKNVFIISLFSIGEKSDCPECIERRHIIPIINDSLKKKTVDFKNVTFIDMQKEFFTEDAFLKSNYTFDAVHLNLQGYEILSSRVRPYVR